MTIEIAEAVGQLIRDRRATRAFLPDPVPPETIETVFGLAGSAPSNANAQPWQVEVVSGTARDKLADALVAAHQAGRRTLDIPYDESIYSPVHQRRRAAFGTAVYNALGIGRGDEDLRTDYDLKSLSFYDAPHVALLYAPESANPRLTADVGMYAQTLLLALAAHGVASCPQGVLSFYSKTIRDTLGVTGGKLLLGISFGYADPDAPINAVNVGREPMLETTRFHR
ncbi:nitroreductase family protein [Streptomyces sp. NPDC086080]|uniref:nitroreductase n=1 Tax=Streptomyces sp. NPDC086080 TaxID=3365748 RepID=UPI0037CCE055